MHETGSVPKRRAALRVTSGALCRHCAGVLLLASCAAPPEVVAPVPQPAVPAPAVAQPDVPTPAVAQPEVPTPAQILRATADTYASCHTYRDSGRVTTKIMSSPGLVTFAPFQTALERPDRFRFAAEYSLPLVKMAWIVWRHGPALRSWSRHDGYEKPESLELALAALAGVSGTSSVTVPKLLLADDVHGPALTEMTDVVRLDDAELGSLLCYCLRGREAYGTTTVWIDQASHLLLRVVRELDADGHADGVQAEVTITYEPVIDEAIPADLLAFGLPEG